MWVPRVDEPPGGHRDPLTGVRASLGRPRRGPGGRAAITRFQQRSSGLFPEEGQADRSQRLGVLPDAGWTRGQRDCLQRFWSTAQLFLSVDSGLLWQLEEVTCAR